MASLDLIRRFRARVGAVAVRVKDGFQLLGRVLGRAETEAMVSHTASLVVAGHMAPLATEVAGQGISTSAWLQAMRTEVKNLYITQYTAGRGGLAKMTPRDWGRLGQMIKDQYGYLDGFARYVDQNDPTVDYVKMRSQLYADASREAFERGRSAVAEGLGADEASWNLNPAEHCDTCLRRSAMGWQPIGPRGGFMDYADDLECWPADGSTDCKVRCKCNLNFRNSATGEEWAA